MKLTKYTSWLFIVLGIIVTINGIFSIATINEKNVETKKILNHTSVLGGISLMALGLIMLHLSSSNN